MRINEINPILNLRKSASLTPDRDFGPDQNLKDYTPKNSKNSSTKSNNSLEQSAKGHVQELYKTFFYQSNQKGYTVGGSGPGSAQYMGYDQGGGKFSFRVITNNNISVIIMARPVQSLFPLFINNVTNKDNINDIKNSLEAANITVGKSYSNGLSITPTNMKDLFSTLEEFWKVVDTIESLGPDFKSYKSRSAMSKISQPLTPVRYYIGAAGLIYIAVRTGLKNLVPRGGGDQQGTFDINDRLITLGITAGGQQQQKINGTAYREHAVPSNLIQETAIDMFKQQLGEKMGPGDFKVIIEVAKMIKRNLVIVLCSTEEAKLLDSKYQTVMPSDWSPESGDVLARFRKFQIPVYDIKTGSRLV